MKTICLTTFHLIIAVIIPCLPDGTRRLVAENLMIKQQLIVMKRSKPSAQGLSAIQRFLFSFFSTIMLRRRMTSAAVILSPATILKFHRALVKRKYSRLFANKSKTRKKPGPKGPSNEVIRAVLDINANNPSYGYPRIADMINNTFGLDIEKDVVRRILAKHDRPERGAPTIPSWQAFIGQTKDSLWTLDLFRCESIFLRSHWVLAVMDICTRKVIGFAVHEGPVDGFALRCMFTKVISGREPRYICHDNDPLFHSWWWQSLAGCLFHGDESREIWSIPYTPVSNP